MNTTNEVVDLSQSPVVTPVENVGSVGSTGACPIIVAPPSEPTHRPAWFAALKKVDRDQLLQLGREARRPMPYGGEAVKKIDVFCECHELKKGDVLRFLRLNDTSCYRKAATTDHYHYFRSRLPYSQLPTLHQFDLLAAGGRRPEVAFAAWSIALQDAYTTVPKAALSEAMKRADETAAARQSRSRRKRTWMQSVRDGVAESIAAGTRRLVQRLFKRGRGQAKTNKSKGGA